MEDEQIAINKCIQQLEGCAAANTVLHAKKVVLHFHTKDELYAAASAWVCL